MSRIIRLPKVSFTITKRVQKFFFKPDPTTLWEARLYGPSSNGWATPLVTLDVAVAVLTAAMKNPETPFTHFTVRGHRSPLGPSIALTADEDNTTTITPDKNWLYDIADSGLGFLTEDYLGKHPPRLDHPIR